MVHFSFNIDTSTPLNPPPSSQRRLWKLSKLKDPDTRQQYQTSISNNLQELNQKLQDYIDPPNPPPNDSNIKDQIDSFTMKFYTNIYQSLESTIGSTNGAQQHRDNFWTAEIQRLVDHRELCYQKWRSALGFNKMAWWLRHQEASARVRRALKKRNSET